MARRQIEFFPGEYYHIYNRGCSRENIFLSRENYLFLLRLLRPRVREYRVSVIAYCLMPNHYHFLFRQDSERSLGDMMQSLFNSYVKAFNTMYGRSGTLFEGPFKAIHVDKQDYLEWIGRRKGVFVDLEFIDEHFPNRSEYVNFVHEYVPSKNVMEELSRYQLD